VEFNGGCVDEPTAAPGWEAASIVGGLGVGAYVAVVVGRGVAVDVVADVGVSAAVSVSEAIGVEGGGEAVPSTWAAPTTGLNIAASEAGTAAVAWRLRKMFPKRAVRIATLAKTVQNRLPVVMPCPSSKFRGDVLVATEMGSQPVCRMINRLPGSFTSVKAACAEY